MKPILVWVSARFAPYKPFLVWVSARFAPYKPILVWVSARFAPYKPFIVVAVLPLALLAILAALGARQEVGVVLTGGGAHAFLGATWVAMWLASIIVSPIAALAAVFSFVLARLRPARELKRLS